MSLLFVNMKENYFIISQANFIASGCLRDGESMTVVIFRWPMFESVWTLRCGTVVLVYVPVYMCIYCLWLNPQWLRDHI